MKKGVVSVIPCPWGLCPWVGLILNQTDFDHSEKFKLKTEKSENSDDEMSDENESEDVSEKRITLLAILEAFNAPIKFDQAWAIIYIVS